MKAKIVDKNAALWNKIKDFDNGASNGTFDAFIAMLQLPDEKFDAMYDELMRRFEYIFNSVNFQNEMIDNVAGVPYNDIESEREEVQSFIDSVQDEDLSDKKKKMITLFLEKSVMAAYDFAKLPRLRVGVNIEKIDSDAQLPTYAHPTDAGADIYSNETITINGGETTIVHTGVKVAIPIGYEIQIRPRSGLSLKSPLRIANSVGTIDSDYRNEVGVIMWNSGTEPYTINKGDRIAQMVISQVPMIVWNETKLDTTDRGEGFGSSGV